jgi:hypothetical protein
VNDTAVRLFCNEFYLLMQVDRVGLVLKYF